MKRWRTRYTALVLSLAALAAAGCGSSSQSRTTAKSPASPSAPAATSSAPTSAGGGTVPPGFSNSTPITDPIYHKLLAATFVRQTHVSPAVASKWATCSIQKLQARGIKTAAEVGRQTSLARSVGRECATQVVQK